MIVFVYLLLVSSLKVLHGKWRALFHAAYASSQSSSSRKYPAENCSLKNKRRDVELD